MPAASLEAARHAPGTDEDLLLISAYQGAPTPPPAGSTPKIVRVASAPPTPDGKAPAAPAGNAPAASTGKAPAAPPKPAEPPALAAAPSAEQAAVELR